MYLKLTANAFASDGVVVVNAAETTGFGILTPGWAENLFGTPTLEASFITSVDTSPAKSTVIEQPREFPMTLRVTGTSRQDMFDKLEAINREIGLVNLDGGKMRYRGKGTYGVTMIVEHIDIVKNWSHEGEATSLTQTIELAFTCQPYANMDPLDVMDTFDTDTLGTGGKYRDEGADWTVVTGGTGLAIDTTRRGLGKTSNLTTESLIVHTGTPHTFVDAMVRARFRFGAQVSGNKGGVVLKYIDANNYLEFYIDDTGAGGRMRLDKVVAGVRTNLVSTALAGRPNVQEDYDVRAYTCGNVVYYTASLLAGALHPLEIVSVSRHVLSSTDGPLFGHRVEGRGGIVLNPGNAGTFVRGFLIYPHTMPSNYASQRGTTWRTHGAVPGDAPADCSFLYGPESSSGNYVRFAWQPLPDRPNLVDGHYAVNWKTGILTGIVAAAATGTGSSTTVGGYNDPKSTQVTTPATTDAGVWKHMVGPFLPGKTYRAKVWVQAPASVTGVRIKLGNDSELATGSTVALTTGWQELTVDWTPANFQLVDAVVAVTQATATASTWNMSEPKVYEVTGGQPTVNKLAYRQPPWGNFSVGRYVGATSALAADITGTGSHINAVRGSWSNGPSLNINTNNFADSLASSDPTFEIPVVPGAINGASPGDVIPVTLWLMYHTEDTRASVTFVAASYVNPTTPRYTQEFGSAGVTIAGPTVGAYPMTRTTMIGTVMLQVPEDPDGIVYVGVAASSTDVAAGQLSLEELHMIPADRAMFMPWGADTANVAKPTGTVRGFNSDGVGFVANQTYQDDKPLVPEVGVFGARFELPPGEEFEWLFWPGGYIPNAPTASSSTDNTRRAGYSATMHVAVQPRCVIGGNV